MDLGLNDTKPDISQLSISSSSSGPFAGIGSSRYIGSGSVSSTQGYGYGLSGSHSGGSMTSSGRYFDGAGPPGVYSGLPAGGNTVTSPLMHSQASMSPAHFNSTSGHGIGSGNAASPVSGYSSPMQSPTSSLMGGAGNSGSGLSQSAQGNNSQSLNPLLANTKHICAICGDRASGKHYGVYSCEGCKGFFKRTVRKELQYACRDEKNCIVDKRQRNRCQYCRYQKCLNMGMKREAVQEERQRAKEKGEFEVESTTSANSEMPVEMILEAELAADTQMDFGSVDVTGGYGDLSSDSDIVYQALDRQLVALVDWAKRIPHFTELLIEDQVTLLRSGWNELLIAGFSHQSVTARDSILLATGLHVYRNTAHQVGIGAIFDRILSELVSKMREMAMDKSELGCLRAIVLFNPDAKGLANSQAVESLREKVYATLDEHCKQHYPDEPGRFAKLLLRLPALRSIGLKCTDHLFTTRLIGDVSLESFLYEMLENPNPSNA